MNRQLITQSKPVPLRHAYKYTPKPTLRRSWYARKPDNDNSRTFI